MTRFCLIACQCAASLLVIMAGHFPLWPSGSSLGTCAVLVGVTIVASGYDKLKLLYWLSSHSNCGKELRCSQNMLVVVTILPLMC
jgi:hypothetical protein